MLPTRLAVFQSPPSRRAILAIGGCALAVVWIVVAVWIGQIRTIGRDAALREIRGFSNLLIDYADRTLEGVDLLLWLLATRLELVTLHGGRIEVESRLGEGTRFTVVLPDAAPAHAGAA